MRRTFLVGTVKMVKKSVYIYGSYRKINTGVPLFWTTLQLDKLNENKDMTTDRAATFGRIY